MSPRRLDLPRLDRDALVDDPIEQFGRWWEQAVAEVPLAEAMTLATVDEAGTPDARMVLLKGFGPDGFRFFTNYESAKARQLEAAGVAAVVVYWRELDRQVRVRGTIARLSELDSGAYFATRPRDSQLGAWASPQRRPVSDRAELDERMREVEERFGEGHIPRPAHWGGYLLQPAAIEFWQGWTSRLHDRFLYTREARTWRIERLGP